MRRLLPTVALATVFALAVVGCTPALLAEIEAASITTTDSGEAALPVASDSEQAIFDSVIDGDTIRTSAGTVRIIGIDTPERGECGHAEASAAIGRLVSPGATLTLVHPAGQGDRDRHGRLLRLVVTEGGIDIGQMQIEGGHAVARYDSRDGYPGHPNEESYHAAQIATLSADRSVITASCQLVAAAPEPAPVAPSDTVPPAQGLWWQQYTSCTRLKKNGAGHPTGPFNRDDPAETEVYQWFAFGTGNNGDGDADGLACE